MGELEMRAIRLFLCAIGVLSGFSLSAAAQELDSRTGKALPYPDLAVNSISVVPEARAGKSIDVIIINIMNRGEIDSAECALGLSCEVIKCDDADKCNEIGRALSGEISVPVLKPREAVNLEWRPESPISWVMGKYAIIAYIDKYNVIRELNEANNTFRRLIYLNQPPSNPYAER
jgi:hypothetical protein